MDMEGKKPYCPVLDVDGVISGGKQFDLDITLPEDNRDVIYGVVKNCFKEPVDNAVVKLVEVEFKYGKKEIKPVSHTFTDKHGEFVFGPLCDNRLYEVEIWVNNVKHAKICTECHRKGECLRGVDIDCKPMPPCKPDKPCEPCKPEKPCDNCKPNCRED